ncbi:hypothetical protein FQN57_003286 [Myotisia sp. PD_48]|nr:hypothetical protein FQN57_003286 [Myotisia sp. PD_48]
MTNHLLSLTSRRPKLPRHYARRFMRDRNRPSLCPAWELFSIQKGVFDEHNSQFKASEQVVSVIKQRLANGEFSYLKKQHIRYAVRSQYANGDPDKALELLHIIQDSVQGILRIYTPSTKLLGAENRDGVTCYLDALLFAMFARLDCFEAVLYNGQNDPPRRNLAVILRLWVNMLRSGKLIPQDITKQLQAAIAACGWTEAARKRQQDASEAFTFITQILELPLLTLKMDIYHTGKENLGDDHKFVNERLLEVAILPTEDGEDSVTLEACLEQYFNSRIEVKRYLERQSTMNSIKSTDSLAKGPMPEIETLERGVSPKLSDSAPTLSGSQEANDRPSLLPNIKNSLSSISGRHRASSIVRERFIPEVGENEPEAAKNTSPTTTNRSGKGSIRKEVIMPAWQVFSLIPWYTLNSSTTGLETAVHFSEKRPILGICLKRYSILPNGKAVRLGTHVDIPVEIGLPHFIRDDRLRDDGPLYGNFKLALQAIVCHRGVSVNSGHYIALVRGTHESHRPSTSSTSSDSDSTPPYSGNYWMRFDDLAEERITLVDIEQALKDECPYLLFYQILPIDVDPNENIPRFHPESSSAGFNSLEKQFMADKEYSSSDETFTDDPVEVSEVSETTEASEVTLPDALTVQTAPVATTQSTANEGSLLQFWTLPTNSKNRPGSTGSESRLGATLSLFSPRKSSDLSNSGHQQGESGDDKDKASNRRRSKDKPGKHREKLKQQMLKQKAKATPDRECVVM